MKKKANRYQQESREDPQQSSIELDPSETKESLDLPPSINVVSTGYKPSKPGALSLEERAITPVRFFKICSHIKILKEKALKLHSHSVNLTLARRSCLKLGI